MDDRQTDGQTSGLSVAPYFMPPRYLEMPGEYLENQTVGRLSLNFNQTSSLGTLFGVIIFYPVNRTSHSLRP